MSIKDGCAAKLAASGDHACGVDRVDEALLAFSTVITCRAQRGRSCEQGAKNGGESSREDSLSRWTREPSGQLRHGGCRRELLHAIRGRPSPYESSQVASPSLAQKL